MSDSGVAALIQTLGAFPGVDGCALVDADTGMTWYHAGTMENMDHLGEAAVELWRAEARLRGHFAALGGLQSAAFSFSQRVVALFPCCASPSLVLVCVAGRSAIAWADWAPQVARLKQALATEFGGTG